MRLRILFSELWYIKHWKISLILLSILFLVALSNMVSAQPLNDLQLKVKGDLISQGVSSQLAEQISLGNETARVQAEEEQKEKPEIILDETGEPIEETNWWAIFFWGILFLMLIASIGFIIVLIIIWGAK